MFQKQHIALLQQIIKDERVAHAERIAELKSAHAQEMLRVIEERDRLRDDLDRTRLFLNPGLANVNTSRTPDTSGPPIPSNEPVGAYQRVMRREWEAQFTEAEIKAGLHLKEKPDGRPRQSGATTPLSEPSPPA